MPTKRSTKLFYILIFLSVAFVVSMFLYFQFGAALMEPGKQLTAANTAEAAPLVLPSTFSREVMGYGTWTMLHSATVSPAVAPHKALQLVQLVGETLACDQCRVHFRDVLRNNPYNERQITQESVALYTCRLHNVVNRDLGKEEFPCNMEALRARWGFPKKS